MKTHPPPAKRSPVRKQHDSFEGFEAPKDIYAARRAATISLIAGAGQIYNGQRVKGILFLSVYFVSIALCLAAFFHDALAKFVLQLPAMQREGANTEAILSLQQSMASGPFAGICLTFLIAFIAFAVRDAYHYALRKKSDGRTFTLTDAVSGSYLFHVTALISFILMVIFFVIPKPPTEQATDIELVAPEPHRAKEGAKPRAKAPETPKPKEEKKVVQPPRPVPTPVAIATPTKAPSPDAVTTQPQAAPAAPAASESGTGTGQSGTGSGSGGGDDEIDFGSYIAELQRRIKKAWYPPKGNESKRITVSFHVHTAGNITELKLIKSSGLAIADDAATDAVEKAAPFAPLPKGAPENIEVRFTFDYNIFNGGR